VRFLVDAQLPPDLAHWLSAQGYPSEHVNDLGLGAAPDDEIEARARKIGAVVWSKDAGFADRARQSPGLQVVWLRIGNTTNAALRARLTPLLTVIATALKDGETVIEIR